MNIHQEKSVFNICQSNKKVYVGSATKYKNNCVKSKKCLWKTDMTVVKNIKILCFDHMLLTKPCNMHFWFYQDEIFQIVCIQNVLKLGKGTMLWGYPVPSYKGNMLWWFLKLSLLSYPLWKSMSQL